MGISKRHALVKRIYVESLGYSSSMCNVDALMLYLGNELYFFNLHVCLKRKFIRKKRNPSQYDFLCLEKIYATLEPSTRLSLTQPKAKSE